MKKLFTLILLLATTLSLFACTIHNDGDANVTTGTPYEILYTTMERRNCKDGKQYDTAFTEESETWRERHSGIELGTLALYGCEAAEDGYTVVSGGEFAIRYKVTQHLGSLVSEAGSRNGAEALWVNRDTETAVLGTDIASAVGVGAYSATIKYTDGTEKSLTKTDFFEGAEKGDVLDIVTADDLDRGKTVASIKVILVYEMYAGGPGLFGIWWHEYTNWRCEYTYEF